VELCAPAGCNQHWHEDRCLNQTLKLRWEGLPGLQTQVPEGFQEALLIELLI